MQRSRSQTLYRHLPHAVYLHDDELIVKTYRVDGERLGATINKTALLDEVERAMSQWDADKITGLRRPSRTDDSQFLIIQPTHVEWDVWPLTFHCTRTNCGRVQRFWNTDAVLDARTEDERLQCDHCGGRLRQLRYYSAHACGRIEPMHTPACSSCGSRDHVYLEDTGSFETAAWRCRACGNAYIKGTRMSPCRCGQYISRNSSRQQAFMRQFTVRDSRTFYPQTVSLLNLKSRTYDLLQAHHARGRIVAASYLGDETSVALSLNDLERQGHGSNRMTQDEWDEAVRTKYRHLDDEEIDILRRSRGPVVEGVGATSELGSELVTLAEQRPLLERATLFDHDQIQRYTLKDAQHEARGLHRAAAAAALERARDRTVELGIDELGVTDQFPIAIAAYGYTRTSKRPNTSTLRGFATTGQYENADPIFTVTTNTEALLVSLSAKRTLRWLHERGSYEKPPPEDERDARLAVLEMFAREPEHPEGPDEARTLIHTLSHVLLRALDDGQTGFGESSLAEWLVPETLTFGIYVSSFQAYTLGALWTLLHNRTLEWLQASFEAVWRCDNDPLCHHRQPRACERCLYLTFGCPSFNDRLSRSVVMDFWRAK